MEAYAVETAGTAFGRSRDRFETVVSWLGGQESAGCTHAELEARLQVEGRELLRQLLQDHLDLRAQRETRLTGVVGADGVARGSAEAGRRRDLATVFGEVEVRRLAYRARGRADLHPADGALNLPEETHSHGLRRLAAVESSRGSFAEAATSVERVTGQGWATVRSSSSPSGPRSTSTASTRPVRGSCAWPGTCWCCRVTARGS